MTVADEYARWGERGAYPRPVGYVYQNRMRQVYGIDFKNGVYHLVLAGLNEVIPANGQSELYPIRLSEKIEGSD